MVKDKSKKTDQSEDVELEDKEVGYQSKSLDSSQVGSDEDVASTDIEKLAGEDSVEKIEETEDIAFGAEHNTDYGGLYKRSGDTVIDQDSDSPPAGVAGHPGIDEDTA